MSESAERPAVDLRVGIFQPCIPRYRVALFERLAMRVRELTVIAGPLDNAAGFGAVSDTGRFQRRIVTHRRVGPFVWMPAMWRAASPAQFDVLVYTWNTRYAMLLPGVLRARARGLGTVLWGHGYSKRETALRRAMRNAVGSRADALLLYGRDAADRLVAEGFPAKHVHVATNALDQDAISAARARWLAAPDELRAFQTARGAADRPMALYVSRLSPGRDLSDLFDAWKLVLERVPDALLAVVGDGPGRAACEDYCHALGISRSVLFAGAVYGEDMIAPWFLTARVLSFPNQIGLTLHHALGYGCPVVTYDTPELHGPEFAALRSGVNGFAIPPGDTRALAARVADLLQNDEQARTMGAAARQTIVSAFTLDNAVDGFIEAIRSAHSRSRQRSGG
jgi:glycosyltransferase involved in cell wall biosynthesis